MNTLKLLFAIGVCITMASFTSTTQKISQNFDHKQTVNTVIGDVSFVKTYGHQPTKYTDEVLRLQTHLKHVEQLLRNKDVSDLTDEQKTNRKELLDLLHEYWRAGVFPKNYEYPGQRIPCFIDKEGNICAVGFLIEKTAGREVAEAINVKYQYEYLLAMNDPTIDSWIAASGLTKLECAMIQPSYDYQPVNHISTGNAISSSLLGGLNVSFVAVNTVQIGKGTNSRVAPVLGLLTGVGQVTLGAIYYPDTQSEYGTTLNTGQRNLSLFNIGIGTSAIALSTWNLIANRKRKRKTTAYNIYSFPTQDGDMAFGFSFSKQF